MLKILTASILLAAGVWRAWDNWAQRNESLVGTVKPEEGVEDHSIDDAKVVITAQGG